MEFKNPVTYLGITFEKASQKSWKEMFEDVDHWDTLRLITKQQYFHGVDEEPFDELWYRYVIIGQSGSETGFEMVNEDGDKVEADIYSVYLVPTLPCIPDSKILEVGRTFGLDYQTVDQMRESMSEVDIAEYGLGVFLGDVVRPAADHWDDDVLDGIATAVQSIDSLRGFYLDRQMNGIGMTGWDFLTMTITDKSYRDFV